MDNYSIDLFTRLDDFRCNFDNDNIYCYHLLTLFIHEIFIRNEQSDEIYLSLQENLKITIEAILDFNEKKDNGCEEILDYNNFNIMNTEDFIALINNINIKLDKQDNYFLEDEELINFIKNILEKIEGQTRELDNCDPELNQLIEECVDDYLKEEYINKESIENIAEVLSEIEETVIHVEDFEEKLLNPEHFKEIILRNKMLSLEDYKCNRCGISEWQGYPLPLKLIYKDNNKYNQNINNIQFLCPNCYTIFKS